MPRPHPRALLRLAVDPRERSRRRRERFLDSAHRYGVHSLGIVDARGHRLYIDPRDKVIGRLLFVEGGYDVRVIDEGLGALAHDGYVPEQFVDIGANIGNVTIEMLSRVPGATAVAFEPDPVNLGLLRQNLAANQMADRVLVVPVALSDTDGSVELELSPDNFGDHRVRREGRPGALSQERRGMRPVTARRFDSLVARGEVRLARNVLTKLDAQGHEGQILAAAPELLAHPMILEFWPYGLDRAGGLDLLLEALAGYATISILDRVPRPVTVDALAAMRDGLGLGHVDLLALP
jgi:FkbM family methyltransferase